MEVRPKSSGPNRTVGAGQIRPTRVDTDLLEIGDRKIYRPQKVAVSRRGMIVTAHYRATEAGVEMLEAGGNAFDAAVAAAIALGVCEPSASGLSSVFHVAGSTRTGSRVARSPDMTVGMR